MTMDGFDRPITLKVKSVLRAIRSCRISRAHRASTRRASTARWSMPRPMPVTRSRSRLRRKFPTMPPPRAVRDHRAGKLIVNALHPAPVALRHIVGHFVPDAVFDAFDKIVPDLVPAEGAGCLCNFPSVSAPAQRCTAPATARRRGSDLQLRRLRCAPRTLTG